MGQASSRESQRQQQQQQAPRYRSLGRRPENSTGRDALLGPGGRGVAENADDILSGRPRGRDVRLGLGGRYGAIHEGGNGRRVGTLYGQGSSTSSNGLDHAVYAPPVQKTAILHNVVFLKTSTLRLHKSKENEQVLLLEFEFVAKVDGWITVYYVARRCTAGQNGNDEGFELCEKGKLSFVGKIERKPTKTRFRAAPGGQTYRQKFNKGLDLRLYRQNDIVWKRGSKNFPIIIRLEADYPRDYASPSDKRVKSQSYFLTLVPDRTHSGEYQLRLLQQQIVVDRHIYEIQQLYGLARSTQTAQEDKADGNTEDGGEEAGESTGLTAGEECVICLTEHADTAVIPCHHLCLCYDCAKHLFTRTRRCPICRERLERLIRITNLNGGSDDEEEKGFDNGSGKGRKDHPAAESSSEGVQQSSSLQDSPGSTINSDRGDDYQGDSQRRRSASSITHHVNLNVGTAHCANIIGLMPSIAS